MILSFSLSVNRNGARLNLHNCEVKKQQVKSDEQTLKRAANSTTMRMATRTLQLVKTNDFILKQDVAIRELPRQLLACTYMLLQNGNPVEHAAIRTWDEDHR